MLIVVYLCASAYATPSARTFSLPEYLAELDSLSRSATEAMGDKTAADTALKELHGDWTVTAEGQTFNLNTDWLTDQFEKLKNDPKVTVRDEILGRLHAALPRQCPPAADDSTTRPRSRGRA